MIPRKAKIDDHWRGLFKRNYQVSIESLSYTGNNLFQNFNAKIFKGLTCIVGKNGIGKSTFIRSLHNAFHNENSNRNIFDLKTMVDGTLEMYIKQNEVQLKLVTLYGDQEQGQQGKITSFLFDPCSTVPTLQSMLLGQDNFSELLDGYQETKFSQEELKVINYLTGNVYIDVCLTVIEDEFDSFSSFPYFKVVTANANYDSRNMGLGELSLFYFFWLVNYINKYEHDKLLFVEEPESFLPPIAQERLTNVLAHSINEYGISCVLSTHSEHILKRVPRSNILIFQRNGNSISSRVANDEFEHLKILGLTAPKKGILLVEDLAAMIFLKALLKVSKRYVGDSFYYHISGSEGTILQDLKRLPSRLDEFRIIGVFDGDGRAKSFQYPITALYTFLPSNIPPDKLIMEYLESIDINLFAQILNIKTESLVNAIGLTIGHDFHDYFKMLAEELNIPYEYFFGLCCDNWIHAHETLVEEFLTDFMSKVD